jgi:starvation-inducible DNA-binding protein
VSVSVGITQKNLDKIIACLNEVLSDTVFLSIKTRGFHWNVYGSDFGQLHQIFDEQYNDLDKAIDTIAERMKVLGKKSLGSFCEFAKFTKIKECDMLLSAKEMVENLLAEHEAFIERIRNHIEILGETKDYETIDMLTTRLFVQGKFTWVLRSYLS